MPEKGSEILPATVHKSQRLDVDPASVHLENGTSLKFWWGESLWQDRQGKNCGEI